MWIFGYGSLIWKVDFPIKRKVAGYIEGFMRRFWQGSTDHRGIPGNPGRVVTLIPAEQKAAVYGVSFEIGQEDEDDVRKHLDHREKGGYCLQKVMFYPDDTSVKPYEVELYIGTETNPNYLGPAPMDDIAVQIYESEGPSGKNIDYLLNLANALRTEHPGVVDPHIFELEEKVLSLQTTNNNCGFHI